MKSIFLCSILLMVGGCSSSSDNLSITVLANPCATKGATYLESFSEEPGGTCGAISDQIVNIGQDGTLTQSVSCKRITQTGCTAQDTGCSFTSDGLTCTVNTDITFAEDGSSSSGLESTNCQSSTYSCSSTYQVSGVRQ